MRCGQTQHATLFLSGVRKDAACQGTAFEGGVPSLRRRLTGIVDGECVVDDDVAACAIRADALDERNTSARDWRHTGIAMAGEHAAERVDDLLGPLDGLLGILYGTARPLHTRLSTRSLQVDVRASPDRGTRHCRLDLSFA